MRRIVLLAQLWFVGFAGAGTMFGQVTPENVVEPASTEAESSVDPQPASVPSPALASAFRTFLRSERDIWTSPLHLKKKDSRWLIPFAAGLAGLIASDRHIGHSFSNTSRQISMGEHYSKAGAAYTVWGAAGAAYLIGRFTGNEKLRTTGRLGGEAVLHSFIVTHAIKRLTGRQRPEEGDGSGDFFQGRVSFPSGHAMMAWSFASVVAHQYHDRKAVVIGAYSAALAVNLGRTLARKHFVSDSLVGSVFGYLIGRYIYRRGQSQALQGTTDARAWSMEITPQYSRASRYAGVTVVWNR